LQQLCNKRILLGVTGGIAAYKITERMRELRKTKAGMDT
jgi:phosphopantothenoylcysteine decarboxylase/phosphopantothenate--cysteine ligase